MMTQYGTESQVPKWVNGKTIVGAILAFVVVIALLAAKNGIVDWCDGHEWVVRQSSFTGQLDVVNHQGFVWKWFGKTWHWPLTMEFDYNEGRTGDSTGDDSMEVTFNDGGTAKVSTYAKIALPLSDEDRLRVHREFGGEPRNVRSALKAYIGSVVKASGPVMSASENQASRKAEFNQIVEDQVSTGLFKMNRKNIELEGQDTIEQGPDGKTITKPTRVLATEIVRDNDGNPIVVEQSPLKVYKIDMRQFSVTDTSYDKTTKDQFAAKKDSYLAAERAKAQRQEEVQQRLMVEEKGRRQVADVQAEENQKKERATIEAQQAAEVAVIHKTEAVTAAAQKTEVAEQARQEALKLKEIAQITSETAELQKKAVISQAEAQKKVLELGGGMSDKDRVTLEIQRDRDIGVAKALAGMPVPGTIVQGGGSATAGGDMGGTLMNMVMLREMGIIGGHPKSFQPVSATPATSN